MYGSPNLNNLLQGTTGWYPVTSDVTGQLVSQKSEVPPDYDKHDPEQKQIYRFVRTLFSAAQLTAECAIVTLVSVVYTTLNSRPDVK